MSHPHISTDSRNVVEGAIYFALRGDKFDGNRYAAVALDGGAVAAVVDDAEMAQAAKYGERMIVVDDVLTTLQQLAAHHRKELGIKILAITGSNGKTTTKELTAAVLAQKYRVYATRGNLNNHIGVPLTLLSMDSSTELGVVEMGASSCGEIALLCSIAQPDYGIVTNIGRAHLDGFGGAEGVKRGKGELLDWLDRSGGALFVAAESEILNEMVAERAALQRLSFSYSLADGLEHQLEGAYNSYNVAAAVAIGSHFGVDEAAISAAIAAYRPTNNRSQLCDTERNRLILDCYNANPSSMEVALNNFDEEEFSTNGDKVLILGDMRELGSWSTEEHQRVIERCISSNAKRIVLVGEEFRKASAAAAVAAQETKAATETKGTTTATDTAEIKAATYTKGATTATDTADTKETKAAAIDPRIELYESCSELKTELSERPISGCTILIKGSRGIGLEQIVTLL